MRLSYIWILLLWFSAVTNLQVIKIIWVMWCMGGQGEAWSWERTALTRHQVMWEGEWRDVYAKKTTAAFTRSFIHFSLSLIAVSRTFVVNTGHWQPPDKPAYQRNQIDWKLAASIKFQNVITWQMHIQAMESHDTATSMSSWLRCSLITGVQ